MSAFATEVKLFGKWSFEDVEIRDISLEDYIAVKAKYAQFLPHSCGRWQKKRFRKAYCPIVERLCCVRAPARPARADRASADEARRAGAGRSWGRLYQTLRFGARAASTTGPLARAHPLSAGGDRARTGRACRGGGSIGLREARRLRALDGRVDALNVSGRAGCWTQHAVVAMCRLPAHGAAACRRASSAEGARSPVRRRPHG
jgi:hypothetical protein